MSDRKKQCNQKLNHLKKNDLKPVEPIATLAPYVGGKNLLHKRITACINQIPHAIYAEPFVGMGGIFFKRDLKPLSVAIPTNSPELKVEILEAVMA